MHFENKQNDLNHDGKVEFLSVLADFSNFLDETTSLICVSERLGIEVDVSTKCHPEIAGVEYSWGQAKVCIEVSKWLKKRGKKTFIC